MSSIFQGCRLSANQYVWLTKSRQVYSTSLAITRGSNVLMSAAGAVHRDVTSLLCQYLVLCLGIVMMGFWLVVFA